MISPATNADQLRRCTGNVTDTYDYDASGILVGATGATPNSRLYGGEEFDRDLGLINLRARQYNAATGRFLSLDPAPGHSKEPISFNRYLYAKADPENRIDPLGLDGPGYAATLGVAFALEATTTIALGASGTVAVTVTTEQAVALGLAVACAMSVQISAHDQTYVPPIPLGACTVKVKDCTKIKNDICIPRCGDAYLPSRGGDVAPFFKCIAECLLEHGCSPYGKGSFSQ